MRRVAVLIASAAINVSTIPAVAAENTSNRDVDASQARSAMVLSQADNAADNEKAFRAYYAASFYESVLLRQAAAGRVDGTRVLTALDSVINDFWSRPCGAKVFRRATSVEACERQPFRPCRRRDVGRRNAMQAHVQSLSRWDRMDQLLAADIYPGSVGRVQAERDWP